eukprot:TRINITY_DN8563_c0_g1_i2.p1 TRINITY_DN8563_c0_g1~~TRINITY_DN8563_c0_g1_i2.p1  ORF type:complete len:111 (-),score=12.00 TRINITY_DN8563_c0_g1_i2:33-365(-)
MRSLFFLASLFLATYAAFTQPFYRDLQYQQPMITGNDVSILQALINRSPAVVPQVNVTGIYNRATETAVKLFQANNSLTVDGIAGSVTTNTLIALCGTSRLKGDVVLCLA